MVELLHHGAVDGVTGSCHELQVASGASVLVDCGLFQGQEGESRGDAAEQHIDFPVSQVKALLVTHVHLDHVGRIPQLLAAGFRGPILCSRPSAVLLPLVLEDAVKVGFTRDRALIDRFRRHLQQRIVAVDYGVWHDLSAETGRRLEVKFKPAGHILGSAYIECRVGSGPRREKVVFSGDLGAPYTPLLPAPRAPYSADLLVLESTYGDRTHPDRRQRRKQLQQVVQRALQDRGTVLIPAFSIGRTQELLYELEGILHQRGDDSLSIETPRRFDPTIWRDLEIIVDSPLASRFTDHYRRLHPYWDAEAHRRIRAGRHPLSFEQLTTIDSHSDHLRAVDYLSRNGRPTVVIAASGMCAGGRIVNYLKAMLGDARHDVGFVGYQAQGTPGRAIQKYGPRGGYVLLDGQRFQIRAGVHTLGGYSAHADQRDLLNFVKRMRRPPREIRLVHGEEAAKRALREALQREIPGTAVRAVG